MYCMSASLWVIYGCQAMQSCNLIGRLTVHSNMHCTIVAEVGACLVKQSVSVCVYVCVCVCVCVCVYALSVHMHQLPCMCT